MQGVEVVQVALAAMSLLLRQILHPMAVQDCNLVLVELPHTMQAVVAVWDSRM
jgi:hypothetical protein